MAEKTKNLQFSLKLQNLFIFFKFIIQSILAYSVAFLHYKVHLHKKSTIVYAY